MYETKTVLRTWYELGWYEGWEVWGYTEFDRSGTPRMVEIRRPKQRAADVCQFCREPSRPIADMAGNLSCPHCGKRR